MLVDAGEWDNSVDALRREAAEAGDLLMVATCDGAKVDPKMADFCADALWSAADDLTATPADYASFNSGVPEENDYGRVLELVGDRVTVGWLGSESRTTVDAHRLTFHATVDEARAAANA